MKRKTSIICIDNNNGFSLLEITVVLIIISILLSAVIPVMSRAYLEKAAQKTALDISAIEDASRRYYIDKNNWPDKVATLQSGGYLPSAWNPINPFGYSATDPSGYNYNLSLSAATPGSALIVSTYIPNSDAQPIIKVLLPASGVDSNNNILSGIPVPGDTNALPVGAILPWSSTTAPPGFLLCDGTVFYISDYPQLGHILTNIFGGDGLTTFAVPNLQGKTIFGVKPSDVSFSFGKSGGSKNLVVQSIQHISGRGGGVPYGIDSEPVDDNSGGTDFNEHNLANVPVAGTTDASTSLPPYVSMTYIIKV